MRTRRSAYYGRNNSFSRSYNASVAESEGRYPRTRAAAKLGVSAAAFDAGCDYADITTSEWHHVGKFANQVSYHDTNECASSPAFWMGCARHYKTKAKRTELVAKAREAQHDSDSLADYDCGFRPTGKTAKQLAAETRRRDRQLKLSRIRSRMWITQSGLDSSTRFTRQRARLDALLASFGITGEMAWTIRDGFETALRSYDRRKNRENILCDTEVVNILAQWVEMKNRPALQLAADELDRLARSRSEAAAYHNRWFTEPQRQAARKADLVAAFSTSPTVQFTDAVGKHEILGEQIKLIGKRRTVIIPITEFAVMNFDRNAVFLRYAA